ncbi:hypothetical protein [Arthrobacter sp.]|uniref:hypothetical protein n=1 Tax=Arthrobacter sp. TaxID=1667 RepID=UPI003A950ABD
MAILDADKEGLPAPGHSLIQTIGRSLQRVGPGAHVCRPITDSMAHAISETNRRREIQEAYNKERGVDRCRCARRSPTSPTSCPRGRRHQELLNNQRLAKATADHRQTHQAEARCAATDWRRCRRRTW